MTNHKEEIAKLSRGWFGWVTSGYITKNCKGQKIFHFNNWFKEVYYLIESDEVEILLRKKLVRAHIVTVLIMIAAIPVATQDFFHQVFIFLVFYALIIRLRVGGFTISWGCRDEIKRLVPMVDPSQDPPKNFLPIIVGTSVYGLLVFMILMSIVRKRTHLSPMEQIGFLLLMAFLFLVPVLFFYLRNSAVKNKRQR
ncbi:MAG: hypothetical protein WCG06_00395 [Candidatus Omnitrophota bacterium]